ncbi:hypothetical protein BDV23DRAFT_122618 [Aspergillus alliaceus]|uniref:Uncharacterized protein n=1 Tax=Petromyces alliaceus TaxID=209559 RepID=A0A5N7C0J2_PETAA|nr:hypothetical protein BDV23DRAFT_122618 [Aspergillus alliaceus]
MSLPCPEVWMYGVLSVWQSPLLEPSNVRVFHSCYSSSSLISSFFFLQWSPLFCIRLNSSVVFLYSTVCTNNSSSIIRSLPTSFSEPSGEHGDTDHVRRRDPGPQQCKQCMMTNTQDVNLTMMIIKSYAHLQKKADSATARTARAKPDKGKTTNFQLNFLPSERVN